MIMIIFLIFNEMFVLKKCIFKTGTLVQKPNSRAILMFMVWMRFLSCAFPHPTSTPEHQPAVYFRVQAHRCPWHLSDFCSVLEEKGFDASFWSLFAVCIHSLNSGMHVLLEVADVDVLTAVSSCSWAPSFCEEKHLSHVSVLWKKNNKYRLVWSFLNKLLYDYLF